jgi:hypothetical protein
VDRAAAVVALDHGAMLVILDRVSPLMALAVRVALAGPLQRVPEQLDQTLLRAQLGLMAAAVAAAAAAAAAVLE